MHLTTSVRYILEYAGLRLVCCMMRSLPHTVSIGLGRRLSTLARFFIGTRIALAQDNLRLAFGDAMSAEERNAVIVRLLRLLGEAFIESIIFKPDDVRSHIVIDGHDRLERSLAQGRGVIFLVPHFSMWELASFAFGSCLHGASVIYKPLKNPCIDRYLMRARRKSNLTLIPSKQALRSVIGNLKKGRAVGILFDQNAGRGGIPATFFGKTASTYAAPAVFALKTGCPVLPAYMLQDSGFRRHRLVIGEPFPLIDTGNREQDILANTQQYNDFLEALVRRHPELWFGWLHRRWRLPRSFSAAGAEAAVG